MCPGGKEKQVCGRFSQSLLQALTKDKERISGSEPSATWHVLVVSVESKTGPFSPTVLSGTFPENTAMGMFPLVNVAQAPLVIPGVGNKTRAILNTLASHLQKEEYSQAVHIVIQGEVTDECGK